MNRQFPKLPLRPLEEAQGGIGDFCFVKKMSSESARRVGETLYFARGNVGFKIWSSDGEIDIECVARQVDSMLTSTPTTYCSDANWPIWVYFHSHEP